MKLNYCLTAEDYIAFNRFHQANSKQGRRALPFAIVFSSACAALFMVSGYLRNGTVSPLPLILVPVFVFICLVIPRLSIKSAVRNMIKRGRPEEFTGERTFEICGDTVTSTTYQQKTEVPIGNITSIKEDAARLYIYFSAIQAFVIPFSAFGEGQKDELIGYINDRRRQASPAAQ
ncbi:MAG: YcxB family protein [Christensenellaceae bacterium]|jgi:hypothetical protein